MVYLYFGRHLGSLIATPDARNQPESRSLAMSAAIWRHKRLFGGPVRSRQFADHLNAGDVHWHSPPGSVSWTSAPFPLPIRSVTRGQPWMPWMGAEATTPSLTGGWICRRRRVVTGLLVALHRSSSRTHAGGSFRGRRGDIILLN